MAETPKSDELRVARERKASGAKSTAKRSTRKSAKKSTAKKSTAKKSTAKRSTRKASSARGLFIRRERTVRTTGSSMGLYDTQGTGSKPVDVDLSKASGEGRWIVADKTHGTFVRTDSMSEADAAHNHPENWCSACKKIAAEKASA